MQRHLLVIFIKLCTVSLHILVFQTEEMHSQFKQFRSFIIVEKKRGRDRIKTYKNWNNVIYSNILYKLYIQ